MIGRRWQQVRLADSFADAAELVPEPVGAPGPGEVIVRQEWAGVNGLFDEALCRGDVPYLTTTLPRDLGVEAVGVVVDAGPGVESHRIGDAVVTSRLGGGYREFYRIPSEQATLVPSTDPRYVALRTSAVSALLVLEQAGRMGSGETLVVTAAAGGLGQFLVQFAARAGNEVIGVCSSPAKVDLLKSLGCSRPVNRTVEDIGDVLDAEYGGSVPFVVDTVGGPLFDTLLARLAPRGRLVTAGHSADIGPGRPTPVLAPRVYEHLYWTSASIIGFQNAHYAEHHAEALGRILEWDARGLLEVAIDPTPFTGLESVPAAVEHLARGRSQGKVVVRVGHPDRSGQ
ncbi:MAG: zinc-binding dehydrogenase [Dermatophilaceae bacterium]